MRQFPDEFTNVGLQLLQKRGVFAGAAQHALEFPQCIFTRQECRRVKSGLSGDDNLLNPGHLIAEPEGYSTRFGKKVFFGCKQLAVNIRPALDLDAAGEQSAFGLIGYGVFDGAANAIHNIRSPAAAVHGDGNNRPAHGIHR